MKTHALLSFPPTTTTSYDVEGRKGGGILEDRQTDNQEFPSSNKSEIFSSFNVLRIALVMMMKGREKTQQRK